MNPAYIARTLHHQLLLDEQGVCYQVCRLRPGGGGASEGANRCLGAQYVAAIDPSEPGFLRQKPTLGVPMLLAKVNEHGKICVVRTGALEHFEVCAPSEPDRPTEPRSLSVERFPVGVPTAKATDRDLLSAGDLVDTLTDRSPLMSTLKSVMSPIADDEPTLTKFSRERSMTVEAPQGRPGSQEPPRPTLMLVKKAAR